MIQYSNIINAFKSMGLQRDIPTIVHMDMKKLNNIKGGIPTLMGAILSKIDNILLPSFTYSTMVTPENGPPNNDLRYGESSDKNLNANIFSHTLPSELSNQEAIDILREFPGIYRSGHPIFSFYGLGLDVALMDHKPDKLYRPIEKMMHMGGWMVLVGVDTRV